jgi:galactofuranose transport system permease protein
MTLSFDTFIAKFRRFLPVTATIVLFSVAYALGAVYFKGMRDPQAFLTLFITTPFLLISVVGETFVIITGGIDLSVSGVVALTTVASAALLRDGWNPWAVMPLMLLMGMALGALMGALITYLKVQPFIATLAGMWFARGMCYIISDAEIRIYDRVYKILAGTKLLIPGLSDPVTQKGDYITILVVVSFVFFLIAIYFAHYTRFGRTIYSIGGNNGANEQSARLMGLPVDRTTVLVYTLNGFCSALAGIAYSIYVGSGHGTHAWGFEMTVIAAVVIGGTMLTGGEGYIFGGLFGVLTTALIQTLIQFNGKLSSWWASIAIGTLMLVFIGVQGLVANLNLGSSTSKKSLGKQREAAAGSFTARLRSRRAWIYAGGVIVVVLLVIVAIAVTHQANNSAALNTQAQSSSGCKLQPFRQDQAASLMKSGAVIAYERNGGTNCIDELYAIYPDGKITGDNGKTKIEKQMPAKDVDKLLSSISGLGWFTDNFYSTSHTPCGACYTYYTTVLYQGQAKTVQAVDGGTDAPANYWLVSGELAGLVPKFTAAP